MATSATTRAAKPGQTNLSDGSVSQAFLRACEQIAGEVAARFFTASKAGATVLNGVVTVEVRANEPNFALSDLSTSGVFTADNTAEDMRNYWGNAFAQTIMQAWGQVRVETNAPATDPPSDVEPE